MSNLVCISHLRWDFIWQRPQQLLSRLARQYRVLFVEEPLTTTEDLAPHLEIFPGKGAPNVTVVRLVQPVGENRWIGHGDPLTKDTYANMLVEYLKTASYDDPILWLYTPMASDFVAVIQPRFLIVDVMDQLSAFKGAPPSLIVREETLLCEADVVFTGGASLYKAKLPLNPATLLFPSGVDVEHFSKAATRENFPVPVELAGFSGPIIGYFGEIDERMDLDLLAYLAKNRPGWNIVLIGPVVKITPDSLPQASNLHYLDMKTYDQLLAYLAYFDVALIPFLLNETTRFLSPTRTLEYMAAHKPIVSTPIKDVIDLYGNVVRVATYPEDFIRHVEAALSEDVGWRLPAENKLLAENTWDNIALRMSQIIAQAERDADLSAAA